MAVNRQSMESRGGGDGSKRAAEQGELLLEPGKKYLLRFLPRDLVEYERPEGADDIAFMYKFHYKYVKANGSVAHNIVTGKQIGRAHV